MKHCRRLLVPKLILVLLSVAFTPVANAKKSRVPFPYRNVATFNVGIVAANRLLGVGGGLEYQRTLNEKGTYSLSLPVYAMLGNDHVGIQMRSGTVYHEGYAFYAAPGFRYHPIGSKYFVDPFVGIVAALGSLTESRLGAPSWYGAHSRTGTDQYFMAIPMLQLGLNLHMDGHNGRQMIGASIAYGPSGQVTLPRQGVFQLSFRLSFGF